MGKPILDRLIEKKNKNKMTAAEKKAQERERKKEEKTQRRIEEENIRDDIFDTEELLLKSEKQFQKMFWSELEQARIEEQEGKKIQEDVPRWEWLITPTRSSRLPKSVLRNREKILNLKRP